MSASPAFVKNIPSITSANRPKIATELEAQAADRAAAGVVLKALAAGAFLGTGVGALNHITRKPRTMLSSGPVVPDGPTYVTMGAPTGQNWIQTSGPQNLRHRYRRGLGNPFQKSAAEPGMIQSAANTLVDNVARPLGVDKVLDPGRAVSPWGKPWTVPAAIGAGAAGVAGGWRLVDWLSKQQDKGRQDADLARAKSEYESALQELHGHGKMAAVDEAATSLQKQADGEAKPGPFMSWFRPGDSATNLAGATLGSTLTYAGVAGVPAAIMAYNYVKNHSPAKALQSALYRRQQMMQARRTPSVVLLEPPSEGA